MPSDLLVGRAVTVRDAAEADLDAITAIWNHEVLWTDATTDTEPRNARTQREWFERHPAPDPIVGAARGDQVWRAAPSCLLPERLLDAPERRGEVDALAQHRRQRVAERFEARRRGLDREARGIEPRRDLLPAERTRHGRARQRTYRERGDDRLAVPVLAPVDVHLATAALDRPDDGGDGGLRLDAHHGEQPREGARGLVVVRGAEREQDVEPRLARGLHVARQRERVQDALERARHLDDIGEGRALGVEIEHEPVGLIERAEVGAPHVERDRPEVDDVPEALA